MSSLAQDELGPRPGALPAARGRRSRTAATPTRSPTTARPRATTTPACSTTRAATGRRRSPGATCTTPPTRSASRRSPTCVLGAAPRPRRQDPARGALPRACTSEAWLERLAARRRGVAPPAARRAGPAGRRRLDGARRRCRTTCRCVMAGILDAPLAELDARWRAAIGPTFERLGLPMPAAAGDPATARTGHSDAFRWLHGEFTSVRRPRPARPRGDRRPSAARSTRRRSSTRCATSRTPRSR